MIDFRIPQLSDEKWIKEKISQMDFPTCEYSFGNIFSYTAIMDIMVAECYGCLVTRCTFRDGFVEYCFPAGNGDTEQALREIVDDGIKNGIPFGIFGMNKNNAELLGKYYSDCFDIHYERDMCDYIYLNDDLVNLRGKKYQPKRNHISFFQKNFNWKYEKICLGNIPECIEMAEKWLESSRHDDKESLIQELEIIRKTFEFYEILGYKGGLLRIDGEVVAFSMGEEISDDIFCVHFEKAYTDIRGAYQMINHQFVANELTSYKYINREDDTGSENLRKAKLSYYPIIIADKYEATYINEDYSD